MKKLLIALGVVFLLVLVAGGGAVAVLLLRPGAARSIVGGQTKLLDYLGAQVVAIANAQLVPDLSFETIRYDPPYTLALGGVRLTAPDGTRVLDLGRMSVTLAETPTIGEPIRVASLTLADGKVNLIRDAASGGLRGLSPLVEPAPERAKAAAEQPETSLATGLVLNKIAIDGIDLVYDPADGSPAMRLDALRADLDIVPATDAGEGWYRLSLVSGRSPGLVLDLDGMINIDSFELVIDRLIADAQLDEQSATTLPPPLSAMVAQRQIRGSLTMNATGRVPLTDPAKLEMRLDATLDDGRAVFGEYQIPIRQASLKADALSGVIRIAELNASTLGGSVSASGRAALGGDAVIEWEVNRVRLRELLASRPADQPPKMAGIVTSAGSVRVPFASPLQGLSGAGRIDITDGRLANIPVVSNVLSVMELTGLTGGQTFRDTFASPLTLSPAGVTMTDFDFRTPAVHARGSGTIGFDGTLDLSINGGPIETIQNKLGKFGSVLGVLTDTVLTYRVRGTVEKPAIKVQPLGIGG